MPEGREEIDLAYRLLDLDLVDSDGRRCGKVDDLELGGFPGEPLYVDAVVTGTGALANRLPRRLRSLGTKLFNGPVKEIPWSEVDDFDSAVELRSLAADLGLGTGDVAAGKIVGRFPKSS